MQKKTNNTATAAERSTHTHTQNDMNEWIKENEKKPLRKIKMKNKKETESHVTIIPIHVDSILLFFTN